MKNKIVLLNVLLFILFSCSSDNDDNDAIDVINKPESKTQKVIHHLSIKEVYKGANNTPQYDTNTYEFFYENGQVSKLTDLEEEGSYRNFEYDKDKKLIKIIEYNNNILDNTEELFYSGNLLSYSNRIRNGVVDRDYFHYTQNLLTMSCNDKLCSDTALNYMYTYNSANNIETLLYNKVDDAKDIFSYDQKINPFKEYNPYFKIMINEDLYFLTLSQNNPVRKDIYSDGNHEESIIYTITYDNENYPLTIEGKDTVTGEFKASYIFDYKYITID
ncbi:hypothetical protein [Apibacter adventoris]|uniref:DUF4595 domain-containing protein n=1 Tax=Apibacter adventoris TaxID=1679466 RepID=A0A2S8A4M3_9FLAO|nr:hypothetical protein [Apibacter adventoris]PQL89507.1 hypothetical protein C4S77_12770 [Apibacter adventoris]